jgi:hypothetical protein
MISLEKLLAIVENQGMDIVINKSFVETGSIGAGAEALVTQTNRGEGTKWVSFYRTEKGGNTKHPYHVEFDLLRGYSINRYHPSDWKFSLDGKTVSSPLQDAHNPWMSFGPSWEQAELYAAQNAIKEAHEKRMEDLAKQMYDANKVPTGPIRVRSRKSDAEARKPKHIPSYPLNPPVSYLLCLELKKHEGSVLDGGVKVIGENRFKTSFDTLLAAWAVLEGTYTALERETRRGEIEIVDARPGFGKRGLYGDRDMKTIEFVVHENVKL